jgi:hypothetical protein
LTLFDSTRPRDFRVRERRIATRRSVKFINFRAPRHAILHCTTRCDALRLMIQAALHHVTAYRYDRAVT